MKSFLKKEIVLIFLSIILGFSVLINLNLNYYQDKTNGNSKSDSELKLKRAEFWEPGPIEIDDDDPLKNWSITAATYNWCIGSGTWKDPYIIENVTIDGQNSNNCIRIDNSNVYFTIRNCTLINGLGGIRLENVMNGRLINNNCSFNQQGIYLTFSNNNTISRNIVYNNTFNGITLYNQCNDTKIIGNTACFNGNVTVSGYGIKIENGYNNFIAGNNASNNSVGGADLRYIYDAEITNNTANNNGFGPNVGVGIYVEAFQNITISSNHVQGDAKGAGITINDGEDCKITNNSVYFTEDSVNIENCINCTIHNNEANNNDNGIRIYNNVEDSKISNNSLKNNKYEAIEVHQCNKSNTISGNILNNNSRGIYLRESYGQILYNNNMTRCGVVLQVKILEEVTSHQIDETNTVNGKLIHYYVNETNLGANNFSNPGQIILANCNDSIISNLNITHTSTGIALFYCNNITISKNNISHNNLEAIALSYSNTNLIYGNTLQNNIFVSSGFAFGLAFSSNNIIRENIVTNNYYGVALGLSDYNLFYMNYFIENEEDVGELMSANNQWDNGTIGNYWDEYLGVDANDDGIGDTPYDIPPAGGSVDNYPIWDDGDDLAPIITINSPIPNQLCGVDAPTFSLTIVEPNILIKLYSINGRPNITFTIQTQFSQTEWNNIGNGTVSIIFYVIDKVAHINSSEVIVRKDANIPDIKIFSPIPSETFGNTPPDFNISIIEDDLVVSSWYTVQGNVTEYPLAGLTGSIDQNAWNTAPEGEITITFYAQDRAGNIGTESVTVIKSIPSPPPIPGYDVFLLIGAISVISVIIIRKLKQK